MMGAVLLAALVAATLVDAVRTQDPAAVLDHMATLGRSIDLSDAAQVRAAIGPTEGLPSRRSTTTAFAGYTLPGGEIVFNPDQPGRAYLGVSLAACMPTATVRARLRTPEFVQAATKSTVALYEDTPYRARPGTAFTFHEEAPGCTRDFGIRQQAPGA